MTDWQYVVLRGSKERTHTSAIIYMCFMSDQWHCAVVKQRLSDKFSLPKGRQDPSDADSEACAMRELAEEVIKTSEKSAPLLVGSYLFERQNNLMTWWLVVTPDAYLENNDVKEIRDIKWIPLWTLRELAFTAKHVSNRSFRFLRWANVVHDIAQHADEINACYGW